MAHRVEAVWNAEVIATRSPGGELAFFSVSASCVIVNESELTETSPQALRVNAVNWIAEQTGISVDDMSVVALHWSETPFVHFDQ